MASRQVLDWFEVHCPQCVHFGFAGHEAPVLERLDLYERVKLCTELGTAADAGDPVYLFGGVTRLVLGRSWRVTR